MSDRDLFEVFNAPGGLHGGWLFLVRLLSGHVAWLTLLAVAATLVFGPVTLRRAVARLVHGAVLSALLAVVVSLLLRQPRPGDLELGHQYFHALLPSGFPSVQVTVLWALALGALTLRPAWPWLGALMLPLGLLVGWAQVYAGLQFPTDVLAAAPVAAVGVGIAHLLRRPLEAELTQPLLRWIDARRRLRR